MSGENKKKLEPDFSPTFSQKLLCGAISSEADLLFTHPLDTIAKYKQTNKDFQHSKTDKQALLKKKQFWTKLFNGGATSALNKALSRTGRFTLQDTLQQFLQDKTNPWTASFLNEKQKKAFNGALGGVTASSVETVILHPLDTLKTRKQLNVESSALYRNMYRGLAPALLRNSFSSAIFFGSVNYLTKKDNPSTLNNLVASTEASLVTTALNNPIEVVKNRLQTADAAKEKKSSMVAVAKQGIKEEGMRFLTKGIGPRLAQAPFKSALPFFTFRFFMQMVEDRNKKQELEEYQLKPA